MAQLLYPIAGNLSLPLLVVEWICAILRGEMGIIFVVKYFKNREKRTVQDLGFAALCFGFAAAGFIQIIADFNLGEISTAPAGVWAGIDPRTITWNLGFLGIVGSSFTFIILMERHVKFFRKYHFTLIYAILTSIYIAILIWGIAEGKTFALVFGVLIFFSFFAFLREIAGKLRAKSNFPRMLQLLLVAVVFFLIGYVMTTDIAIALFGLESRLVGDFIEVVSFVTACTLLLRLPPITMLEWEIFIENIFLIGRSGICLFQKSFAQHSSDFDDSLLTSAIATVNTLIQEMVAAGKEGLTVIKKEKKYVTIFSSALVTGAAICTEDNPIVAYNLKLLVEQFEAIFGDVITNWNGNGSVFRPVDGLIDQIFSA
ncbi:MAG TPA: hypothetical protein VKK79_24015 [Candidatus Lokiarchaeia archaeon]|nr:hypothetical protein [Candidatus Lokiarchaeia archaeon]